MNAAQVRQFALHQLMIFLTFLTLYHVAHYTGFLSFTDPDASLFEVTHFAVMTHSTIGMSSLQVANAAGYVLNWVHIALVFWTIVVDVD